MRTATSSPPSETLRAKALLVNERLCEEYGAPIPFFHDLDPLSELVSSLLSHRTRNADSGRAFKQLRARFADWPAVRDAPTARGRGCHRPLHLARAEGPSAPADPPGDHRAERGELSTSTSSPRCR